MKNISFAMTTRQFLERQKTVTRRLGWNGLRPGMLLCGIYKGMGLKLGESPQKLAVIVVVDVRRESLNAITPDDVEREGFPGHTPAEFISLFCKSHSFCKPSSEVTRIEFRYVPWGRF